jgi:hypothetical protein
MFMPDFGNVTKEQITLQSTNYIENTTSEAITKRTIDNITYTIKARPSEGATKSLGDILDARIARDIAKIT